MYGFRHESAAHVKNHIKSTQNKLKFTASVNSANSLVSSSLCFNVSKMAKDVFYRLVRFLAPSQQ